MPLGVTLRFDPGAAARIERLWQALADRLGADDALRLGYPPHITLAVLPDEAPVATIEPIVDRLAAAWRPLPVRLAGLAVFPEGPVLWAAPAASQGLLMMHRQLQDALPAVPVHPHYRPGAWVPHVTLAKNAQAPAARLIEAALSVWDAPIQGVLDRLDLVRFRPVVVLRSEELAAPADPGRAGSA